MKTVIYYLTGTGNSLAIARRISAGLKDCELRAITLEDPAVPFAPQAEAVGFVYPAYFLGLPLPVRRLVDRGDFSAARYLFAAVNSGGMPGKALLHLEEVLKGKGRRLNAGFHLYMPDNYLPMFDAVPEARLKQLLGDADRKAAGIAEVVEAGLDRGLEPTRAKVDPWISVFAYPTVHKFAGMDRDYWTQESCNGCGLCEKACPFRNIRMESGQPHWLHHCEMCMRCIHLCPKRAIQFRKNTVKRWRYKHPEITLQDLLADCRPSE